MIVRSSFDSLGCPFFLSGARFCFFILHFEIFFDFLITLDGFIQIKLHQKRFCILLYLARFGCYFIRILISGYCFFKPESLCFRHTVSQSKLLYNFQFNLFYIKPWLRVIDFNFNGRHLICIINIFIESHFHDNIALWYWKAEACEKFELLRCKFILYKLSWRLSYNKMLFILDLILSKLFIKVFQPFI